MAKVVRQKTPVEKHLDCSINISKLKFIYVLFVLQCITLLWYDLDVLFLKGVIIIVSMNVFYSAVFNNSSDFESSIIASEFIYYLKSEKFDRGEII